MRVKSVERELGIGSKESPRARKVLLFIILCLVVGVSILLIYLEKVGLLGVFGLLVFFVFAILFGIFGMLTVGVKHRFHFESCNIVESGASSRGKEVENEKLEEEIFLKDFIP